MDTFSTLGLSEPILKAIEETGYETPTPIQLQAIPPVIAGGDVLGIAQTGTGKTAAFALPILHRLAADRRSTPQRSCRALILSPTRELASQIADSFRTYGKHLGFTVAVVFGGVSERPQAEKLQRGVDILVATPGRLLDHMGQRNLSLAKTEIFVLDEADQMLDLGFFKAIRRVVADLPKVRQSLFFSATMPGEIEQLTRELLTNPTKVAVTPESTTVERVTQRVIRIEQNKKKALLATLLADDAMQRTLVFTRTKRGADRVAKHLTAASIVAAAIHGNKSQNQREAALHSFRTGHTRVLVATDIAARGIDIDEVSHVVNFELPEVPEAYVHRIGRTARAGASGSALSFCDEAERHLLRDIERVTRQVIESEDRRNDASLAADKPTGRGGHSDDEDRPRGARGGRPQRSFGGGGGGRGREGGRPDRGGDRPARHARPERGGEGAPRGDRPARADRPDNRPARPERRDGDRPAWQSRNRDGDGRGRNREGADKPVWSNHDAGDRPDREERNERRSHGRPTEGGRPPFRQRDERGADRRPERGDREGRPHHARSEHGSGDRDRSRPNGERRFGGGDRSERPHHAGPRPHHANGDRPRGPRPERNDRPDRGERPERGERPSHAGPREGRPPHREGGRPHAAREGGRDERPRGGRSDRPEGWRSAGPRRDEHRGEGRTSGGPGRDRPRPHGNGHSAGANGGSKRPSGGQHREGGRPEYRKPAGAGGAPWRGRDDRRPPRRDGDGA